MKGLPGSGKSTYAKKLLNELPNAYKRINRDELRAMFDNGYFSNGNEKFVKQVRDMLILKALEDGKHVIVDDTNLSEKNEIRIRQLVQQFNKEQKDDVQVQIVEMETSLEECIARDVLRENPVGAQSIKNMHQQSFRTQPEYAEQDTTLPKALICDLDGTLALLNGRNPYDATACENDLLNIPVAQLIRNYAQLGYSILLVSGRKDDCRIQTENWLAQHEIPYELLLMRNARDNRKDAIIKKEIFDNYIAGKYAIELVLDDRDQVVELWRNELRLPCFQVYYGNF